MSDVDVKAKLVLDDEASKAFENIKRGFADTSRAGKEANSNLNWFKQTLSTFAAVNLTSGMRQVFDFGKSFLDAAAEGEHADHAVASLIMTAQNIGWDKAHKQAQQIGDDLDDIAIKAGVSNDALTSAFQNLISLSGGGEKSVAGARDQISKMATIAGVTGMSIETISSEFGFMEEGVLRTKGHLFQLLQTTGIFGDKTKGAGAAWAQMTDANRHKALEFALGQVAKRMGEVEPSAKQMMQSLDSMWDATKEKLGDPILRALLPEMKKLAHEVLSSGGAIESFAKTMAAEVPKWVKAAGDAIRDGFKWIKEHQEDIKSQIIEAWTFAKGVVSFIIDHKEALALAYGAKLAAPAVGGVIGAGRAIAGASAAGIPALGIGAGVAGGAGAAGAAIALGAFTAAIAGVGAAAWQYSKLLNETGGGKSERERDIEAIQTMFKRMSEDQIHMTERWSDAEQQFLVKRRMRVAELATLEGKDASAAVKQIDAMLKHHAALRQQLSVYENLTNQFNALNNEGGNTIPMIDQFTAGIEASMNSQDSTMTLAIAQIVAKNRDLAQSFAFGTNMTASAMDSLANMIKGKSVELDELAKQLEGAAEGKRKGGVAAAVPKISIGSATFKIEQNFQSDDSDRVFLAFEKDVNRVVENRLQAITTSPFGV